MTRPTTSTCEIDVPASTSAGSPVDVTDWTRKAVYLSGGATATVQVQISPETSGSNWHNAGSAIVNSGFIEFTTPCRRVRANVTFTSGVPVGRICLSTY